MIVTETGKEEKEEEEVEEVPLLGSFFLVSLALRNYGEEKKKEHVHFF